MARPSTYSILACDLAAGEWGVAVQSKFLAVGAGVPSAEPYVGAVATQALANMRYGPGRPAALPGGGAGGGGGRRRASAAWRKRRRAGPSASPAWSMRRERRPRTRAQPASNGREASPATG